MQWAPGHRYAAVTMSTGTDQPRDHLDWERLRAAASAGPAHVGVLDTSELRWFAAGRPPRDVLAWFSADGDAGTLEERCDTYQVHGLRDIGVKRRSRQGLEVKVLRATGPEIAVGAGLVAPFEDWRKWSPTADDPMWPAPDALWMEVYKAVITRTFMLVDHEVAAPATHEDDSLAGCDVEVAAVTIGGVDTWTFSFEAFGPKPQRHRSIVHAWDTLIVESGLPGDLGSLFTHPVGYPAWLDHIVTHWITDDGDQQFPRLVG